MYHPVSSPGARGNIFDILSYLDYVNATTSTTPPCNAIREYASMYTIYIRYLNIILCISEITVVCWSRSGLKSAFCFYIHLALFAQSKQDSKHNYPQKFEDEGCRTGPISYKGNKEFSQKSNLFFSFLIFFRWSRLSRDVRILLYKIRPGFYCFTCVSSPLQSSHVETRTAPDILIQVEISIWVHKGKAMED